MRTLNEIKASCDEAIRKRDMDALNRLAGELRTLESPPAIALSEQSIGITEYFKGLYQEAIGHYHKALVLFEELHDHVGVARSMDYIGMAEYAQGAYSEAMVHFSKALQLHKAENDRFSMARVLNNIGNVHCDIGSYGEALVHYTQSLELYEELKNQDSIARVTNNIGLVHYATGSYPDALQLFRQALLLHETSNNLDGIAQVTGNIGIVYFAMTSYREALEYYQTSLAMYEQLGNYARIAAVLGNIGMVHTESGSHADALVCFGNALAMHEEQDDRSSVTRVKVNVVAVYIKEGRYREAAELLDQVTDAVMAEPHTRLSYHTNRALIAEHTGDMETAHEQLHAAMAIAVESGIRDEQAAAHLRLRDLAQQRNDFAAYIEHNNEYTRINEEVRGTATSVQLAMQEKQREIDANNREMQKHIAVLHSTLPKHIADRVARGETVNDHHACVAVLFLDLVGFTTMSSAMEPSHVVELLERIFGICDEVMNTHGMMKIKTIGDSYMAVAFDDVHNAALAALDLVALITEVPTRIGIHCGPVVAGVIGKQRMQYDVWGDTVNVASRMESSGEAGRVQVSEAFAVACTSAHCVCIERGAIDVKGKGSMKTFWLVSAP
ncbi:hypothetical protein BH10BAC6_BH10BAC6_12910 [soil metagenome]